MPTPLDPAQIDDAIQRYLAGQPAAEILSTTGISNTTLHRERTRRGIPPRTHLAMPDAEIAAAYLAGESEYSISLRYGVSRETIRKRLQRQSIQARGTSAAGKVRAAQMTTQERLAQAAAAHDAVRGVSQSIEFLNARAAARQARGGVDSPGEQFLVDRLRSAGFDPVPQQAIGKYNVDIAVAPVAVEVLGGGWHAYKRHHAVRTPQILNAGWHLLFVWNHEGASALTADGADYVVSYLQEIRRNPPAISEYRVITGGGQFVSGGRADDDQFPLVPPPRGGISSRT